MDANEKLVRDTWQDPMNGMGNFNRNLYPEFMDDWAAAAEFTRGLKQNVAEINYEISLQIAILTGFDSTPVASRNPHYHDADRDAINRTITRLQIIRVDLTRGMKGNR